jgi:hypothetical protein
MSFIFYGSVPYLRVFRSPTEFLNFPLVHPPPPPHHRPELLWSSLGEEWSGEQKERGGGGREAEEEEEGAVAEAIPRDAHFHRPGLGAPPPTIQYVGGGGILLPPRWAAEVPGPAQLLARAQPHPGACARSSSLRACRRTLPTSSARMQPSRASCTAASAQKTPPCCWRGVTPTTADDNDGGSPPCSLLADDLSMTTPGRHRRRSPPPPRLLSPSPDD